MSFGNIELPEATSREQATRCFAAKARSLRFAPPLEIAWKAENTGVGSVARLKRGDSQ
jgi:hypothetical protein